MKKLSLRGVGLFHFFAPIPVLLISAVGVWILFFGVGFGIFGFNQVPDWFQTISLLPGLLSMLVLPVSQILGIVLGIKKRQERFGILCSVLSALGFVANGLLWAAALYAGAHF